MSTKRRGVRRAQPDRKDKVEDRLSRLETLVDPKDPTVKSRIAEVVDQMIQTHVLKQVSEVREKVVAMERGEYLRFAGHLASLRHELLGLPDVPQEKWEPAILEEVKSCRMHGYTVKVLATPAGKQVVVHTSPPWAVVVGSGVIARFVDPEAARSWAEQNYAGKYEVREV